MQQPTTDAAAAAPPGAPELLESEVAALCRRLQALELRRQRVRRRRESTEAQRQELLAWRAAWWGRVNGAERELSVLRAAREAARREVARCEDRLRVLARTHAVNDAFFIWHAGPFATINGLKLGRLPGVYPVDWADVNAGLGLAMLLLATIADRSGYRFQHYRLAPMGSCPKLLAAPPSAPPLAPPVSGPVNPSSSSLSLSLSTSGPGPGGGSTTTATATSMAGAAVSNLYFEESFAFFRRQNFNRALQAFLKCIEEFGRFVEHQDPTLRLPYRIQDGMVGDLPIVFTPGSEEAWTRALKYLVTDLKWLVAWSVKHT